MSFLHWLLRGIIYMFVLSEADKRGVSMKRRIKTGIFISGALSAALLSGCGAGNQVVDYGENPGRTCDNYFFWNKYETENVIVIEEIITGFMKKTRMYVSPMKA